MKQRVYKSTSEDREGDLVNVILEPTVYISSPFACPPFSQAQARVPDFRVASFSGAHFPLGGGTPMASRLRYGFYGLALIT